jgi:thiol-disulfide isomerase/thioredoxin
MQALILALVIGCVAVLVAQQLRKRKPEPPTQQQWTVPQQLDRNDFVRPDAPWLVVLFSSSVCDACERVNSMVTVLESNEVAVANIDYQSHRDLHQRYGIDAVPTTVIADNEGVVGAHFIGPPTATDLWAAIAELREPGSTPPPEAHKPIGT